MLCAECRELARAAVAAAPPIRAVPRMPLAVVSLAAALACSSATGVPCSASDHPAQAALTANAAACELKFQACTTSQCVDDVAADCKADAERICK